MDRREFFQTGLIATLAGTVLADRTLARALQAPAAPATAPAGPPPTPRPLTLDAYSPVLHWIRDPDQVAEAVVELTCGGIMPDVGMAGSAHIDATKVKTDLPAFVNTMKKHGLKVRQIRGGNQTAVDASVEELVGTMAQAGATHYTLGTDNYDFTKPIMPQLDAIKRKVEAFVALNQKNGTTLMYRTRAGANSVGGVVWDLMYVLKDFDPKYVGLHWDTGSMTAHGDMWETLMRTAGPYVVGMAWKDRSWEQTLPFKGETGAYPGPAGAAGAGGRGGGGAAAAGGGAAAGGRGGAPAAGAPGAAAAPAAGAAAAGGRGGGRGGGGAAAGGGAPAAGAPAAGAGGRGAAAAAAPAGGRGAAPAAAVDAEGNPAAAAGRGGGGRGGGGRGGDLSGVPRPLAGQTFAKGGGWAQPPVPMGMGLVNIVQYGKVMADINFSGPMGLEGEYPALGGANSGATSLSRTRLFVLGTLKRDVLTIRAALKDSASGVSI